MRQLLVRIDDDLHARLRERAVAQGRSVNALVNDVLSLAVAEPVSRREALRRTAERAGMLAAASR